ncbi:MAG: DUF3105 domain-containing protein [Planctomycetaceae bacterium]|nr:DUF3105 domain-containing protein [Planctomycetales bacterium]MCB9920995.1 DUF3105 domain-containing protein [Planctomycetaceae bacterium]
MPRLSREPQRDFGHDHVWISYNPTLISDEERLPIEQLAMDGGTDTGVIATPRPKSTSTILVTSLAWQLTLDTFDATTIRDFINTNRCHSPEASFQAARRQTRARRSMIRCRTRRR